MKTTGLISVLFLTYTFSVAQQGLSFSEAKKNGITLPLLDSAYQSGIHDDSTKAVFASREIEYITAYKKNAN